jgi:hypothetical protein
MQLVVIGQGAAACLIVDTILQSASGQNIESVMMIGERELAPPCSLFSTAIASSRATQMGISPLGDEIVESFSLGSRYYPSYQSVQAIHQYHLSREEELQKEDRFSHLLNSDYLTPYLSFQEKVNLKQENAFLIHPDDYFEEFKNKNSKVKMIRDFVLKIESHGKNWKILGLNNSYQAEMLFLCQGAYPALIQNGSPLKTVRGSFYEFTKELPLPSLSLSFDKKNFIYDQRRHRVLIGSTSSEGSLPPPNEKNNLDGMVDFWNQHIPILNLDLSQKMVKTGLRAKGKSRRMVVEKFSTAPCGWTFSGFYKNGWILPLLAAHRWIQNEKENPLFSLR